MPRKEFVTSFPERRGLPDRAGPQGSTIWSRGTRRSRKAEAGAFVVASAGEGMWGRATALDWRV